LTLEFRRRGVSKTTVYETALRNLLLVKNLKFGIIQHSTAKIEGMTGKD
jgi:hypothetical protein